MMCCKQNRISFFKLRMLTTLVEKTFVRALRGEITDEEAADQIADSLCADSLANNVQV